MVCRREREERGGFVFPPLADQGHKQVRERRKEKERGKESMCVSF